MNWLLFRCRRRTKQRSALAHVPSFEFLDERCLPSAGFSLTNLISDVPGLAQITDPNLVNPWGISVSPNNPFWFSDARSGFSTVYDNATGTLPLAVTIPGSTSKPLASNPTGTVFSPDNGFSVSEAGRSGPSLFLFATMEGTISGWNPTVDSGHAILAVDNSGTPGVGPVYTGLALATSAQGSFLYAANFRAGTIDVFDANFNPVHMSGAFTDPKLPAGFVPFNIQNIGGSLFVTYTRQDSGRYDQGTGPGDGFVDVFDAQGDLVQRLVSDGPLDAPWGVALAPADFGVFGGDVLIGNFGDGHINAFDPNTGAFLGALTDDSGAPVQIPDLWGMTFDEDASLYITAGIGDEQHGLVAELQPSLAGADGSSGEETALLNSLPASNIGSYPLPPANGPALRTDGSLQTPVTSVILPVKDAPLGLVPTLLAAPGNPGSVSASNSANSATVLASTTVTIAMLVPSGVERTPGGAEEVYDWGSQRDPMFVFGATNAGSADASAANRFPSDSVETSAVTTAREQTAGVGMAHGNGWNLDGTVQSPAAEGGESADPERPSEGGQAAACTQSKSHWQGAVLLAVAIPFLWTQRYLRGRSTSNLWSHLTRRLSKTVRLTEPRVSSFESLGQ